MESLGPVSSISLALQHYLYHSAKKMALEGLIDSSVYLDWLADLDCILAMETKSLSHMLLLHHEND